MFRSLARGCATSLFRPQHQHQFQPSSLISAIGIGCSYSRPQFARQTRHGLGAEKFTGRMGLITINQSIVDKLKDNKVIPDVIDEFSPSVFLQVEFPSDVEAQLGNTLKESDTQSRPKIIITPGKTFQETSSTTYTICMTDPDAPKPSDPKNSEFLHWLITGVGSKNGKLDFDDAKTLVKYMGPAPPEGTGKHRYVLLFFKNGKEGLKAPEERGKWGFSDEDRVGARKYARKYDLTLLGANFFYCQHEK